MTIFWATVIIFLWISLSAVIHRVGKRKFSILEGNNPFTIFCLVFLPIALPYVLTKVLLMEYDRSKELAETLNIDLKRKNEALRGEINELDKIIREHENIESEI